MPQNDKAMGGQHAKNFIQRRSAEGRTLDNDLFDGRVGQRDGFGSADKEVRDRMAGIAANGFHTTRIQVPSIWNPALAADVEIPAQNPRSLCDHCATIVRY
ncbi:MAG: hypothetical protein JSS02_19085 [Planctomycetes bacterium]|nr:hypothetical protein [Planctomycetota bacterium]